jgi:hypothetical protein
MCKDLLKLIELQGNMRVKLLQLGLSESKAEKAACDFFQNFIDSGLMTDKAVKAFNDA